MAQATRTETVDVDINKLYDIIVDYAKYPDFVDGVSSIKVLSQDENKAKVEYAINLIKSFKYTIVTTQKRPTSVSWVLESGDIFKTNNGSWELKDLGNGKTEVTYSLEVDLKMFAPGAILKGLTEKNLPIMMNSFFKRAKSR